MKTKIAYKVNNKVHGPELGNAEILGEIGRRIDRFIYERVSGEFARTEIIKEAEEAFRHQYDDEVYEGTCSFGLWAGEFWGKLIISAARVCRVKNSSMLREYLREAAYELLKYQREDGYLNTYRESRNMLEADPELSEKLYGWKSNSNWNIWCRKYTMWGLLECAQLLEDEYILNCVDRMAEQLITEIDELQVRLKDTGVMDGTPACSIMKPILILYRLTGKEKYYEFACKIVKEWNRSDNEKPNLIHNALSGKPVEAWYQIPECYPPEKPGLWIAKAYEMMSCFEGLCELYRISGETLYLDAVKAFYEMLKKEELNILGSVGYCERFASATEYPDAATEI